MSASPVTTLQTTLLALLAQKDFIKINRIKENVCLVRRERRVELVQLSACRWEVTVLGEQMMAAIQSVAVVTRSIMEEQVDKVLVLIQMDRLVM